jgi:hypothetical protein
MNEELNRIQQELKAPKGQTNSFGNYKYRSCEDILEAVKPLLNGLTLTLSDEVVNIGTANYVKATAILCGSDLQNTMGVTAYAREAESKKGMDEAQITGAASSYARKYALNGLFAIDDTKDADSQDNTQHVPNKDPLEDLKNKARKLMSEHGFTGQTALNMSEVLIGKKLPKTKQDFEKLIEALEAYNPEGEYDE